MPSYWQADRERLAQMLFERFNLNGLFLADQAVLNLYAVGKTTGLVVDLGHGKAGAPLSFGTAPVPAHSARPW